MFLFGYTASPKLLFHLTTLYTEGLSLPQGVHSETLQWGLYNDRTKNQAKLLPWLIYHVLLCDDPRRTRMIHAVQPCPPRESPAGCGYAFLNSGIKPTNPDHSAQWKWGFSHSVRCYRWRTAPPPFPTRTLFTSHAKKHCTGPNRKIYSNH